MDSEEGPLPVYRKNGLFFSYASRIPSRSLQKGKKNPTRREKNGKSSSGNTLSEYKPTVLNTCVETAYSIVS